MPKDKKVKFVQIVSTNDGTVALDDKGQSWFLRMENYKKFWSKIESPNEE